MTYFGFLLRFLVIPILLLLVATWRERDRPTPGFKKSLIWTGIFVHVFLAVVYTTPWDNYLVATGVWYYNPKLVTGIVFGYVPLEEYTFFVLESVLTGLWWWSLVRHLPLPKEPFQPSNKIRLISFAFLVAVWAFFVALFFSGWQPGTYLSITLVWALPAIIPQLLFGADILWHYRKLVALTVIVPGIIPVPDGHRSAKRYHLVHFSRADHRHTVFRHPATRRSGLLFHHQHAARLRYDADGLRSRPGAYARMEIKTISQKQGE